VNPITDLPEVHSISGAEIEPEFRDTLPYRLHVSEKSLFQAVDANPNPRPGLRVKSIQPIGERLSSTVVLANQNLSRNGFQSSPDP
jgi:hypothetical protein